MKNESNPRTRSQERQAIADVATQLAELEEMTVGELVERYREVFGEPTRSRNKGYLRKKVAWRIQEVAEGGLSDRTWARIEMLAAEAPVRWRPASHPSKPTPAPSHRDLRLPEPGTILVRDHGGKRHEVTVLVEGFEYGGRCFKSLSRIAREITGTQWNGFLFFSLRSRRRGAPPEDQSV